VKARSGQSGVTQRPVKHQHADLRPVCLPKSQPIAASRSACLGRPPGVEAVSRAMLSATDESQGGWGKDFEVLSVASRVVRGLRAASCELGSVCRAALGVVFPRICAEVIVAGVAGGALSG